MPKITLTDAFILGDNCACPPTKPQEDFRDAHPRGRGLVLRVTKGGLKKWNFIYSLHGRERRLTLAEFGRGKDQLTLAEARKQAAFYRAEVLSGEDPASRKAEAKAEQMRQRDDTFERALTTHLAALRRKGRRESYIDDVEYRLRRHLTPHIGKKPFPQVNKADLKAILSPLEGAGMVASYNRLLAMMQALWGSNGIENPALADFEQLPPNDSPEPFQLDELRKILAALADPRAKVHPITQAAIRFAALTLKRSGVCAQAEMSEIDTANQVWSLPPSKTKSSRPDAVPLSSSAMLLIGETLELPVRADYGEDPEWLFVSPKDRASSIVQPSMSRAFNRARKLAGVPSDGRSLHSIRHSGATALAATGVAPHIIQRLLGHKFGGGTAQVTQRYNQYDLLSERRECLETLAQLIEHGDNRTIDDGKVVSLLR